MTRIVVLLVAIYRNYLSPFKLRCCRFYPSCSQYTIDAVTKYGVVRGGLKSMGRIFRCNPFCKGGYDPA